MGVPIEVRRNRRIGWGVVGLMFLAAAGWNAPTSADDAGMVEIITSPDRAHVPIDRAFVRAVFTLRTRTWPDGTPVRVFVLPDDDSTHQRFCNERLGIYPYRLRDAWDRAVFTGTGLSPRTVNSLDEMRASVRRTPGAIGYAVRAESPSRPPD